MDCPHGIPVYEYCEACCGPAPEWRPDVSAYEHARIAALPDLEAAYLDLHDEVRRLRATGEIDRKFARKTADDVFAWKSRAEKAEAERDRLLAVLDEIATAASGIARDIQIGPDDEGRDIYEMVLAIRDDARAAPEGHRDWQRDRDRQIEEGTW